MLAPAPLVPAIPMGSGTVVPAPVSVSSPAGASPGLSAPGLRPLQPALQDEMPRTRAMFRAAPVDTVQGLRREIDELRQRARVAEAVGAATQKPVQARFAGVATVYDFREGGVYQVYGGVERVTDIALQPGEKLSGEPIGGDTVRWIVSRMKTGSGAGETWHVVIKPLDEGIETNILIPTDRRVYRLQVRSSLEWFMPGVRWTYPADEAAARAGLAASAQREERQREPVAFSPDKLDFGYVVRGDDVEWKPVRVFNDGSKTFLQMPPAMKTGDAPALFVIEDGGEPMLVNYRVKDGVYMVDRLFRKAELRVGVSQRVTIQREAPARPTWGGER